MAKFDKETVRYLADLSRIDCSEAEQESLFNDLTKILEHVNLLQEVDTEGVAPCNHVLAGMTNVMREDIVGETMPRETFLANAPEHTGGLIRVPTVIKKNN